MAESRDNGNGGPTWRWIVGVAVSLLLVFTGYLVGSFSERLGKAENKLEAQAERLGRNDTRVEIQSYRISADSSTIQAVRRELQQGFDEVKQLLRRGGRGP